MMMVGVVILIAIIVAVFMSMDEATKRKILGGTTGAPTGVGGLFGTTNAAGAGGMGAGYILLIILVVGAVLALGYEEGPGYKTRGLGLGLGEPAQLKWGGKQRGRQMVKRGYGAVKGKYAGFRGPRVEDP